jgi:hypothetical protein
MLHSFPLFSLHSRSLICFSFTHNHDQHCQPPGASNKEPPMIDQGPSSTGLMIPIIADPVNVNTLTNPDSTDINPQTNPVDNSNIIPNKLDKS